MRHYNDPPVEITHDRMLHQKNVCLSAVVLHQLFHPIHLFSYTASGSISYDSEGKTTAKYGSEGYVVRVYSDAIVFQGADLSTKKIIPTVCFIMPVM